MSWLPWSLFSWSILANEQVADKKEEVIIEAPLIVELAPLIIAKAIISNEDLCKMKDKLRKPAIRKPYVCEIRNAKSKLLTLSEQKQIVKKVNTIPEFLTCKQNLRHTSFEIKHIKQNKTPNPLFVELISKVEQKKMAVHDVFVENKIALLHKIQTILLKQRKIEILIKHHQEDIIEVENCLNYGYSENNLLTQFANSKPVPIVFIELKSAYHYAKDEKRYFEKNKIRVFYGLDVYKRTHPYQMFIYLSDFVTMLLEKKLPQKNFLDFWGCDGTHCDVAAQMVAFFENV